MKRKTIKRCLQRKLITKFNISITTYLETDEVLNKGIREVEVH